MIRRFPFFSQLDAMDCGPACLRMVAAFHGRDYPLPFLREQSLVDREGASLLGLARAAEAIGLEAMAVQVPFRSTEPDRTGLADLPLPCIVHWKGDHFVVVYRMDRRYVWIADPETGRQRLDHAAFQRDWRGAAERGVVLLLSPLPDFYEQERTVARAFGFGYLLHLVRPYRRLVLQLLIGLLVLSVLQLMFPFLTQAIVDVGIGLQDLSFITLVLLAMLFIFLGETTVNLLQGWILLHLGTRVNVSLVSHFLQKLMRLPLRFFDQKTTGDLLQRIYDQQRIEAFLTSTSLQMLFSLFTMAVLGMVLWYYHLGIFLLFLGAAALYLAWIGWFLQRRAVVDQQRFRDLTANQNALIELIEGMPEIKLQQSARRRRYQWAAIQQRLFRTNVRFLTLTQYQDTGAQVISQLKDILIIFVAARSVLAGELTLGMMLAIQYVIGQMNVPLQQLAGFIRMAQDARLSLARLGEVYQMKDEAEEDEGRSEDLPAAGSIHLAKVSFAYNPLSGPVLQEVELTIPAGRVTAIVGPSGSGKTTLVKLLLGFYAPGGGSISVGGRPLSAIRHDRWRRACGAVLQDGFLFADTIARNIAESDELIDEARLEQAAQVANLLPYLDRLPLRYQTRLGPDGLGLSQGQRQRLLIARAVYKAPDYLFFDEATNALDAENERLIVDRLAGFFAGRTVVVVAHRLSTVRQADQIVVLDEGRVVETGTHDELVARRGRYFSLIRDQLELGN
jgi:ATP-binding cassette subfamily B protein